MMIALQWIMSTTLILGALFSFSAFAQTIPDSERAVLHAEQRLAAAVAEVGANVAELLDELVSTDFLGVDTSGRQFDKAQWVLSYREIAFDPTRKESWTTALREYSNQDLSIRMYGNAAVVTGWRKRGQGGHRFVHVWKLQQGQWKLVVSQSTLRFPYPDLLTNGSPDSTKR